MDNMYKHDDIAIIGISGRFPEADTISDFWNNLACSKESIRELPLSRKEEMKSIMDDVHEKNFIKSGYLDYVTLFEPEIYSLNHEESKYIDPQHRLLLELVEEAILDAGYNPEKLANHYMGVFIAGNSKNYTEKLCSSSPMAFSNSVHSSNAGRIAYVYNFHGPVLTLDTACSSSLVALHYACKSLQLGECAMALAGGSKISLVPTFIDSKHYNPVASKNQQVRTFDKDASGTVGGEGGGIVLLKLLKNALEEGDQIHAIIKGTAINSDGRWSNGMSAPSEKGQADVIVKAVENAQIDPLSISYIETHGTGTELGDPIEVAGIKRALEQLGYHKQAVSITSLKPNIGHLDSAAGIASVIKTVLALKNKKIPPSINFTEPNPLIKFENTPVYVNDKLSNWDTNSIRRAAVTSLGLIGTNCNVILEEAPEEQFSTSAKVNQPKIVELSARTKKSLNQMVENLIEALDSNRHLPLTNIAYTLNTGRRNFNKKFVLMAESTEELLKQLNGYSDEKVWTYSSKDPEMAPIFIVPDLHDIDLTWAEELYEEQPVYQECFDQSMKVIQQTNLLDERKQNYLAHLYAYTELVKSYSVQPKAMLGFGMGDIVADLARNQISLEQAVQRISNYDQGKIEIPVDRLGVMVDKIVATKINTFLLIWPAKDLIDKFNKVLADKELTDVILNQGVRSFYAAICKLIKKGLKVDWEKAYQGQSQIRVSLPGYAFDRKSYMLPVETERMNFGSSAPQDHSLIEEIDSELLHNLVWTEEELNREQMNQLSGTWVIFNDQSGLGKLLAQRLNSEDVQVIQVSVGDQFEKMDDLHYQLQLAEMTDYELLVENIYKTIDRIDGVLNLFNCHPPINQFGLNYRYRLEENLNQGYYSVLYLTQALLKKYKDLKLYQITTNAYQVLEDDALINPAKRMIWTLNKVINQEIEHYQSYCIDFDLNSASLEEISHQILSEMQDHSNQILEIAYRKNKRFVQYFSPLEADLKYNLVVKNGGVYLITGGTGGVGLELAKYIASTNKAHLILLNRTPLSEKNLVDKKYKLEVLEDLQKNGTTVELMYGDVADYLQMKEVIAKIKVSHGKIDGVVHAAGVSGGRPLIPAITKRAVEPVFAPKVAGTLILAELLRDQFLDFFATCSSLSSQVGGFGFGIYATANSFLDSYCALQRQMGKKFMAINWGNWGEVGIGATMDKDPKYSSGLSSLKNVEGMGAFAAILNNNLDNYSVTQIPEKVAKLYESFSFFKIKGASVQSKKESNVPIDSKSIEESLYLMLSDLYIGEELELTDRVLDLNLDSIDVMQFVTKVKKAYNVNIPIKSLFEDVTVDEIFSKIKSLILGEKGEQSLIIKQPDQPVYPVSTSQNRLYLISKLDEESTAYNLNIFWYLEGDIDQERIESVVNELIKRHESLRTSFNLSDGKVIQKVHQEVDFGVEYFEVEEAEIESLTKKFVRPFDLRKAPLIRIGLANVGDEHLLMMDLHHIIFDGISQNILFEEFFALYKGEQLPDLKLQYRDFAVWQHELLNSEEINPQKDYWREVFSGEITRLNLPTDYPRPKVLNFKGNRIIFSVHQELTDKLNELAKAQGVTMFMLLLGAFNVLIGKYANQEDIIIGSPIAGRHHPDLENIIGMFVNTIPLRNYPEKSKTFSEFLKDLKENTLRAYESQDYPLEMIVDGLDLVHDPGRNPLFDIEFNLNTQRREHDLVTIDGIAFKAYGRDLSTARFDLSLTGVELGGKIELKFEYRTALFDKETIDQLTKDLLKVLEIIVGEPDIKIHDIKLVEELEELETGQFADIGFDF